jgi:serine/threonine protein kinase
VAQLHQIGQPVNDGERLVLRLLKERLPDDWHVVGNFGLHQGNRNFDCDALSASPDGWAYLVEVKAWLGEIVGNDSQWALPALAGAGIKYMPNPVDLTQLKARVLATVLREASPVLKGVFIQPLVVLVSDTPPRLTGACADYTVLIDDLVTRVQADPREYTRKTPPDVAQRTAEVLEESSVPIAPASVLGAWELVEEVEAGQAWEVWSARNRYSGERASMKRLKRYRLDPLLTGEDREKQRTRARRDLEALERLAGVDGAVPLVGSVEEIDDSFVVVTDWPDGRSLESMLAEGPLDEGEAEELVELLVEALASIHRLGVVHRALTPRCVNFLRTDRVVITDFDYARLPSQAGITQLIGTELDVPYAAPEVRTNPANATTASDVWSAARIAAEMLGAAGRDGPVTLDAVPSRWQTIFERALSDQAPDRPSDADLLLCELRGGPDTPPALIEGFRPNDELEDRWVVRSEPVGEGGIARVYRVFDTTADRDFAAKFVRDEYTALVDPSEEYRLLRDIPEHPGVVKPEFPVQMTKYRRGDRQYELRASFLLTPWIEGTRVDRLVGEKLPPLRCVELVSSIADAVAHLHAHGLLHRDLKPQNVIVDESGHPRLVDFNVSRSVDIADRTQTGTPRYRPPDLDATGWSPAADVFALGVILCELLAGRLVDPGAMEWLDGAGLPDALEDVVRRAVAAVREQRFQTAEQLSAALHAASEAILQEQRAIDRDPFPLASDEELARSNWNPYQARLVSLFSQSRTTNAGTRGLNDFARWSYVPTRIDERLYEDIVRGRSRLLVITGNAGDGKTAFIQMFESRLERAGATIDRRPDGNGAVLVYAGRKYVTNWDGSQDEGDEDNNRVLLEFFGPFSGEQPEPTASETRVIAINEGRLLDFLSAYRDQYPWLSAGLLAYFEQQTELPAEWLAVVNLNLRALTVRGHGRESIVAQLLGRFADQRIWEPCSACIARSHCYARANGQMLQDPVLGPRAGERIRQTLDLVRLRRRLHITMRDLRSALAWSVAGNRTCDEIVRLVEDGDRERLLSGHLYNALFAASDKLLPPARSTEASEDRLLNIVGTLDVAKTATPDDDAKLWSVGVDALLPDPHGVDRADRQLLRELRERLPLSARELADRRARADLRLLHSSLRRKLFLEREDPAWIKMLPYERLEAFTRQLDGCSDGDRDDVVRAISYSEGLFSDAFNDLLAVRLASETTGAERSFVTHAATDFRLAPLDRSSNAVYVEYAPDTLRLAYREHPALALDIDVDLFETLTRVLAGFTPSREELRGAWLNLRIFKEQVARLRTDSLLLSNDDRRFHRVTRIADEHVIEAREVS